MLNKWEYYPWPIQKEGFTSIKLVYNSDLKLFVRGLGCKKTELIEQTRMYRGVF